MKCTLIELHVFIKSPVMNALCYLCISQNQSCWGGPLAIVYKYLNANMMTPLDLKDKSQCLYCGQAPLRSTCAMCDLIGRLLTHSPGDSYCLSGSQGQTCLIIKCVGCELIELPSCCVICSMVCLASVLCILSLASCIIRPTSNIMINIDTV